MPAMQFRTVNSPVGPLTLAGKDGRLMHLVMVDQAHQPSHGGWERDDKAFSDAVAESSISSLIWLERTSSDGSGRRC
jgi:methylated-DNA-[protein]-cysteine S-methyltransferase